MLPEVGAPCGQAATQVRPLTKVPAGHELTQVPALSKVAVKVVMQVPVGHVSAAASSAASSMTNEHDRSATGEEEDPSRFSRAWLRVCRVEKNTFLLLPMRENSAPFSSKTASLGSSAPPSPVRAAFGVDSAVGKYSPKLPANFFGPSCRAVWNGVSVAEIGQRARPAADVSLGPGAHRRTPRFARCRSFRRR